MAVFQIGDKVETIDDVIEGLVTNVSANQITIETDDGFLLDFEPSELVKIDSGVIKVTNYEANQIKAEKALPEKKKYKSDKT